MIKIENPAFDYNSLGQTYSTVRQTDPRIARFVHSALSSATTILNVGAGSGSYEPQDKYLIAVEPSVTMRHQRLQLGKVPAIDAKADSLPFNDKSFDAAMAMVTVHHWPDIGKGLREIRRVTKHQIATMTFDPDALEEFWNFHYFPELIAIEKARYPKISDLSNMLGENVEIIPIPIPLDCLDGFQEAFYGRPEAFLDPQVRLNQSAWGFLPSGLEQVLVKRLDDELKSGAWDRKFGHYRNQEQFKGALRLIIFEPASVGE